MPVPFDELEPGLEIVAGPRTITDADVRAFAALSGDDNPLHTNDEAARAAGFSSRIAHGMLGLAAASGLLASTGLTRGSLIALAGVNWRFIAPIFPGDAIRVRIRVAERRESSKPGRDVVRLALAVLNQDGQIVQEGEAVELVRARRPTARPGEE